MNLEPVASPLSEEEMNLINLPPLTTGLVSSQGDSRAILGAGKNGERVENRANGWEESLQKMCQLWHLVLATGPSMSYISSECNYWLT